MDFLKNAVGSGNEGQSGETQQGQGSEQSSGGGFLGGLGDKFNSAAGGGKESEKNEDFLDKGNSHPFATFPFLVHTCCITDDILFRVGVDAVQQYGFGQGPQDNESAVEQAKDEQISDMIRSKYKSTTGSDIPIEDKKTALG